MCGGADLGSIPGPRRLQAIGRLTALVAGGAAELESFSSVFKRVLMQPMAEQVNDLRSSIVKAACVALAAMSAAMGDDFEP